MRKRSSPKNTTAFFYSFLIMLVVSVFILNMIIHILFKKFLVSEYLRDLTWEVESISFMYILRMENHYFTQGIERDIKKPNFSKLLFENTINLSLSDPRSFFRNVLPGFSSFDSKIIVAGEGTDYTNLPIESSPPIEVLLKEREISEQNLKKLEEEIKQTENTVKPPPLKKTTGNRNVMFIYHSHSRESFLPYLKGTGNEKTYHHSKINITMVGKRLGEALRNRGIGVEVDTTDIVAMLKKRNLDYSSSYEISREIVASAKRSNRDLSYFLDIHRDSQPRKITTITINGKTYARLFFIVGKENKNYEKNLAFAQKINTEIEKSYPGLSRGIIEKDSHSGNGVYNQDLSPNSVIIEIGGIENTMDELYRTADALGEVLNQYYWDATKVSNTPKS